MAANTTPIFVEASALAVVQVSAANTARDGSGTLASVVTGGADGTLISLIRIVGTGTTTAGVVRLFVYDTANNRLVKEIMVTAITPSTSVEVYSAEYAPSSPLILKSGWILKASTHIAETFNVFAFGYDY